MTEHLQAKQSALVLHSSSIYPRSLIGGWEVTIVARELTMSLGSNLLSTAGILAVLVNVLVLLCWIREVMKKVDGWKSFEGNVEATEENL